ncbi:transmembrane protein, putative [Medicago truncatula]|uniref:Transmembrane protein, putative n=1 Tax=Medicago truncatula TaxID=3880 RepID=A0A072VM86_MEDTR|nr:transmembrane protein, putative [Medicago truncatula]
MKADFQLASAAYVRNIGHSLGAWVLCFWLFLLMLARPIGPRPKLTKLGSDPSPPKQTISYDGHALKPTGSWYKSRVPHLTSQELCYDYPNGHSRMYLQA